MDRVAKKPLITLRVENGRPVLQPRIKIITRENFEGILPAAAGLMQRKMNEVNWRETPWGYEECEQTLRQRFERPNFHTPAIAFETPEGALKSIIFPVSWKPSSWQEGVQLFLEKTRFTRIKIRLYLRKERHAIKSKRGTNGDGLLSVLREEARIFWNESRAPFLRIITILREEALTLWNKVPSTWKMGFDDPWKADRPDGTHVLCPQVFGGPRELIHGGVIPLVLSGMLDGKYEVAIAFSRFSDLYKYIHLKLKYFYKQIQLKLKPKQYIAGIIKGKFEDRIIGMHWNYGAVPSKIFRKGCDDPHSLDYSVLMDYTPLIVFVAASLGGDAIRSAMVAKFGKKYSKVVRLADKLNGRHVTAETDGNGTNYTIDYSPFLAMMNSGHPHKMAKAEKPAG